MVGPLEEDVGLGVLEGQVFWGGGGVVKQVAGARGTGGGDRRGEDISKGREGGGF